MTLAGYYLLVYLKVEDYYSVVNDGGCCRGWGAHVNFQIVANVTIICLSTNSACRELAGINSKKKKFYKTS